jgi:two-component system sensor histidine kinase/response regulator
MNIPTVINAAARSSKLVVGVDDSCENVLLLQAVIKAAGYTFPSASSGAECLTLLTQAEPRLILLDIEMPEMDGFETCRRLRHVDKLAHVPVAFLTARRMAEDVKQCMEVGGNDFIVSRSISPSCLRA